MPSPTAARASEVAPAVREAAIAAARSAGERGDPSAQDWIHHGTSSLVMMLGDVAVRVGRGQEAGRRILRAQRVVDALPELPVAVPRSAGDPVRAGAVVAVPTRRLRGEPHPAGRGEPEPLCALLEAVGSIDPDLLRDDLAHPREFLGGTRWYEGAVTEVVPLFPARWRREARARLDALAALEAETAGGAGHAPTLRHGDLAGSNVLWEHGAVTGVLDWDLAAIDDPAEDAASLAWWHGWELLPRLTDARTARRAEVFRRSFPIQSVVFAHLEHGGSGHGGTDEIRRAVERSVSVLEREAGA